MSNTSMNLEGIEEKIIKLETLSKFNYHKKYLSSDTEWLENIDKNEIDKISKEILVLEKYVYIIKSYIKSAIDSCEDSYQSGNIKNTNVNNNTDKYKNDLVKLYNRLNRSFITLWEVYNDICKYIK